MNLIIDTNMIISALIKDSTSRRIILSPLLNFYSLSFVSDEIRKYIGYVKEKTGVSEKEILFLLKALMGKVIVIPDEIILRKTDEAVKIMKGTDINDAPIIACALVIENDGIWTEDKHFEKQKMIRIWRTSEIIKYMDTR